MKKAILVALMFLGFNVAVANACEPQKAVEDYYGGQEIQNLKVEALGNGFYSIELDDTDGPAHCTGGVAKVDEATCKVTPTEPLYCAP